MQCVQHLNEIARFDDAVRKPLTGGLAMATKIDQHDTPALRSKEATEADVGCLAIADAMQEAMRAEELRPKHVEGYPRQEWILLDYSGFVVHIFTPRTRSFYDLERLWGGAARVEMKE